MKPAPLTSSQQFWTIKVDGGKRPSLSVKLKYPIY